MGQSALEHFAQVALTPSSSNWRIPIECGSTVLLRRHWLKLGGAMNKGAVANVLARVGALKRNGSFYIGTCNDAVIAGYALDAPPSAIYIWKFVLPTYDDIEFLHLSLGRRIMTLTQTDGTNPEELDGFIRRDWRQFSEVSNVENLVDYIETEGFEGTYADWVRYLTHIKQQEFDLAERLHGNAQATKRFSELQTISKQFHALLRAKELEGWEGCASLLDEWVKKTKATFC